MVTVAALFVEAGGVYFGLEGVDPWPKERDARKYPGPHPVIAHPDCGRWGRFAGERLGLDDGCFEAALAAVDAFGGVLEHPADSHAWKRFGLLKPPRSGGWTTAGHPGLFTCCVEQGHYGHRARKATWLLAKSRELPSLKWGRSIVPLTRKGREATIPEERARARRTGVVQNLSAKQRRATPLEFALVLLSIARSAHPHTKEPT
jgi:hypothetical protein